MIIFLPLKIYHFWLIRPTGFLLEIKESLSIKRDKPELNANVSCAPLFLYDMTQYNMIG